VAGAEGSMTAIWVEFLLLATVVFVAGWRLTVCADRMADAYGLSRSWIGVTLVGFVTSLPELISSTSAAALVKVPDMAAGNVLGSIMFNLAILAAFDLALRREGGVIRRVSQQHVLSAAFVILLVGVLLLSLVFPASVVFGPLHFGLGSVLVVAGCLGGYYVLFRFDLITRTGELQPRQGTRRQAMLPFRFAVYAAAVVASAMLLAGTGDRAARATGISHTFFGTLFLAAVTSMPELVVSLTAFRLRSLDLLVGNILGSNMINVTIIAFADLAYVPAALHIPDNLGWGQVFTGLIGIIATAILIVGLMHGEGVAPAAGRRGRVGLESLAILAIYAACIAGLYFGWGRG